MHARTTRTTRTTRSASLPGRLSGDTRAAGPTTAATATGNRVDQVVSLRKPAARRASGRTAQAALRASRVRMVVVDVDGVLPDGRLYFGPDGEALKVFDVRDGHGVRLLREAGLRVAVLSSRASPIVE